MNILITGASGFIGRNLAVSLKNLRDGKDCAGSLEIGEIYEYDFSTSPDLLDEYCRKANFVFSLAGVNRPKDPGEFFTGNCGFAETLLSMLRKHRNACPVMFASSVQAATGSSEYADSKRLGEQLFFRHAEETGAPVLVYRFPNVFGKWCRPNYNSAVATFCHNIARGLPVTVDDRNKELSLLYIDDLVEEMRNALEGGAKRCDYDGPNPVLAENGRFCHVPATHRVKLGEIIDLLEGFKRFPETLLIPEMPEHSFVRNLYATYLTYLPEDSVKVPLTTHADVRGSFTELLKTANCGQVSVNIIKPGVTKGQHWHGSKWECFIVVSGSGLIRERRIGSNEVQEFEVSGERIEAVRILPGYTHSITNVSDERDLVTVMWASERFDPRHPDTFLEKVSG